MASTTFPEIVDAVLGLVPPDRVEVEVLAQPACVNKASNNAPAISLVFLVIFELLVIGQNFYGL
jgi:hypothetical protein